MRLGRTTPELMHSMTWRELMARWEDYQDEPWGEYRVDLACAQVALTVYQVMGGKKRLTLTDFMPLQKRRDQEQSAEDDIIAAFASIDPDGYAEWRRKNRG